MGRREDAARTLREASAKANASRKRAPASPREAPQRNRPHAWPAPPRSRNTLGAEAIFACLAIAVFAGPMACASWGLSWAHGTLCSLCAFAIALCAASLASTISADEASRHGRAFHKACVAAFCSLQAGSAEASAAASALESFSRHWCRSAAEARRCEGAAREALAALRATGKSASHENAREALAWANARLRTIDAQRHLGNLSKKN